MITLIKFYHRGAYRIGMRFAYDQAIKSKIKQLPQLSYSKTIGCWYIPYEKRAYQDFLKLKIPFRLSQPSGTTDEPSSKSDHTAISTTIETSTLPEKKGEHQVVDINGSTGSKGVDVSWHGAGFRIACPYVADDIEFIKGLYRSWWNPSLKQWNVKSSIENLEKIQAYFQCFSEEDYVRLYDLIGLQSSPRLIELFSTPEFKSRVLVKIKGFGADIAFIKTIPERVYDKHYRRWSIPNDEVVVGRVVQHYSARGYNIVNRLPQSPKVYEKQTKQTNVRIQRLLKKHEVRYHGMLITMTDALIRMKYSWSTLTSYTGKLVRVAEHFKVNDVALLSVDQVNRYLAKLAKEDISNSTINLIQSAIKFYFEKAIFVESFEIEKLSRPRKGRRLPSILSIQEVDRLLRQSKNLKHTTILYAIYGGGLRLSEVLGLRVQDIHWDRDQVFVKAGKGKKDRMVMLSGLLKELLKSYFDEYQPAYWLFEGADGKTQYSPGSVQKIVKNMARKAGISRRVTPHTLRHCFATHLLDRGLDCRYIQELLGHRDIKTTLIYTHVSNQKLNLIASPLDDMKALGRSSGKKP